MRFLLLLLTFSFSMTALADRTPASEGVERSKFFDLKDGHGRLFVIVYNSGELRSHKYLVEVRPTCGGVTSKWRDLPAMPVVAACHVDSSSIHYDRDSNSIEFKIFRANPAGGCRTDFESIRFPLSHLCDFE